MSGFNDKMKIVGIRGNNTLLVDVGGQQGIVFERDSGKAFPPFNIHSIIARGYWEEYTPTPEDYKALKIALGGENG